MMIEDEHDDLSEEESQILSIEGYVMMYNDHLDTYGYAATVYERLNEKQQEHSKENIYAEMFDLQDEIEQQELLESLEDHIENKEDNNPKTIQKDQPKSYINENIEDDSPF